MTTREASIDHAAEPGAYALYERETGDLVDVYPVGGVYPPPGEYIMKPLYTKGEDA